jgi:nicotinamide-nucleotide amidase
MPTGDETRAAASPLDALDLGTLTRRYSDGTTTPLDVVAEVHARIAGSSDVVDRAFVTYANEAKREMLGVSWDALLGHGAVSDPVARAMAAGALARSGVDLAVSVTGVAGPGGGTAEKPVGLVYLAGARTGHDIVAERHVFPGDRDSIRRVSVITALTILALLAER